VVEGHLSCPLFASQASMAEPKTKRRKEADTAGTAGGFREAPVYDGGSPTLEGIVSAWYTNDGLTGTNYGFIERLVAPSGKSSVGQMEHHLFEADDVSVPCRAELRRGLRVQFRSAGKDSVGRWRAVQVALAAASSIDLNSTTTVVELQGGSSGSGRRAAQAALAVPTGPSVMDITRELVLKAWKKLGGEATWHEIVGKIKKDRKLSERVANELSGNRQSSSDEVWEELVPKILKADGEWTGEKRATEGSDKAVKVFRFGPPA